MKVQQIHKIYYIGIKTTIVIRNRQVSILGSFSASLLAVALFLNSGDERIYVPLAGFFAIVLAVTFWTERIQGRWYYLIALAGLVLFPLAIDVRYPHRPNPMACDAGQCMNPPINEWTAFVVAIGALGIILSAIIHARFNQTNPNN